MRPCLAPVGKLAGYLVELMVGVQRGLDRHGRASKSSGSFHKDDCRPFKFEIHAGWSEAHVDRVPDAPHVHSALTVGTPQGISTRALLVALPGGQPSDDLHGALDHL